MTTTGGQTRTEKGRREGASLIVTARFMFLSTTNFVHSLVEPTKDRPLGLVGKPYLEQKLARWWEEELPRSEIVK